MKKLIITLGLLLVSSGCHTYVPSPSGLGSTYEGEINSRYARLTLWYPWAEYLDEDTEKEDD
jgi:hypothetical protein